MTATARLEISGRHAVQYCLQPAIEIQVRKKGLGSLSVGYAVKEFQRADSRVDSVWRQN